MKPDFSQFSDHGIVDERLGLRALARWMIGAVEYGYRRH